MFIVIGLRYKCLKWDDRFESCSKCAKHSLGPINRSEEADARNATLGNETSLK